MSLVGLVVETEQQRACVTRIPIEMFQRCARGVRLIGNEKLPAKVRPNSFGGGLPPGFVRETIGSYEVIWSQQHRDRLFQLSREFQLVWATTWEHSANESMSPILELGQLAVIEFDRGTGDTWKLPSVQEFIGNRPAAWIDDDLYLDAHNWAEQREVPTLLIRTSSSVELTKEHVDQLETFAERCRSIPRNL